MQRLLLVAVAIALAACTGGDLGVSVGGGDADGEFAGEEGAVTLATAPYVSLDLSSGAVSAHASAPDLSGAAVRETQMVFRRINGIGQPDYLIAVFECSQAQWQALGGSADWQTLSSDWQGTATTGHDPAVAVAQQDVLAVLQNYNATQSATLTVPSPVQWQQACDGGSSGAWSWGDGQDRGTVRRFALVTETSDGRVGPEAVGSRQPNDYGLYDLHGNVWEWCSDATARGGSWHDALPQARTANSLGLDDGGITAATQHALIGFRLTLEP